MKVRQAESAASRECLIMLEDSLMKLAEFAVPCGEQDKDRGGGYERLA